MAFLTGQAIQRIVPNKQSKRWKKSGGKSEPVPPPDPQAFVWGIVASTAPLNVFYGYQAGVFGTLTPDVWAGLTIDLMQVVAPSDVVALRFLGNVQLGTTTQIQIDATPGPIATVVWDGATYEAIDIPMRTYVVAAEGTDIPVTLTALN